MRTRLDVAEHRTTLATRPVAVALRGEIEGAVLAGKSVVIDFSSVLAASSSSIDELVGVLGEWALQTESSVQIEGASDEVMAVVETAVNRRQIGDAVRFCVSA